MFAKTYGVHPVRLYDYISRLKGMITETEKSKQTVDASTQTDIDQEEEKRRRIVFTSQQSHWSHQTSINPINVPNGLGQDQDDVGGSNAQTFNHQNSLNVQPSPSDNVLTNLRKKMITDSPLSNGMKRMLELHADEEQMSLSELRKMITTIMYVLVDSVTMSIPEISRKYDVPESIVRGYIESELGHLPDMTDLMVNPAETMNEGDMDALFKELTNR
jgi:uncharacterized protein YqfB (UPF0267 family)